MSQAAVIRKATEREADRIPPNPETGRSDSYAARRLDALYKICSQAIGTDTDADRATVVVYEQADGSVTLPDGTALPDSVAQRMTCDCREQHADGSVDPVISAALRRKRTKVLSSGRPQADVGHGAALRQREVVE